MQNFIPNLDYTSLTDAQLSDEIGRLDIMTKAYQQALEAAKSNFKMRGVAVAEGENFTTTVRIDTRWTLDTKAVKKEMGDAWYEQRSKVSTVATLSVKANLGLVATADVA